MRPHGQTKLGFFPLPIAEAKRLKNWLTFPERFSALDPCVGDGVAFADLLQGAACNGYWNRGRRPSGGASESLGNRDSTSQHHGCAVPTRDRVLALPESSLRLGSRREQQPEIGVLFSLNIPAAGSKLEAFSCSSSRS